MSTPAARNFGPAFGCELIVAGDRICPRPLEHPMLYGCALVGLVLARRNIPHSRAYLTAVTGRPASIFQVWKHYERMIYGLGRKLRAARGLVPELRLADAEASREFVALAESGEPALFGTFHVGDSDLLGCMLARKFSRRLTMVRLRVGNSTDTDMMAKNFGDLVDFLWVNRPEDVLFGIKDAMSAGASLALQCDREEHASKTGAFTFLGARRRFPVTIYHLAALFRRPVAFAFAMPQEDGHAAVHTSPVFRPDPEASRAEVIAAGEAHFQQVLNTLEAELRRNPYVWFNFTPLNTAV